MDGNAYVFGQMESVMEEGQIVQIKVRGPKGDSKWVNITPEKFEQILDLFQG